MATILCVDDTLADLQLMQKALSEVGHHVIAAEHVPAAMQLLHDHNVDLIVSDYRLPKISGLEFITLLQREGLRVPLIMNTAYATVEDAVSALKAGAIDYITKPLVAEQLQLAVDQALELTTLRRENNALRGELYGARSKNQIVGESMALREVLGTVTTVAPTCATILIQGESGTGKELIARAAHDLSDRSRGAFVAVNCAAIPENLVESSLFGHEKGAFTGATRRVEGAFERAHRGTLLLDEVSEMDLDLQAKLLRALQEQEFERVGGSAPVRVNVRVIATTNRDLAREVRAGRFREDLFFRLAVVPIRVPPLRERREDIAVLAQVFAKRAADRYGKDLQGLAPETLVMLRNYEWPGNVRELQHAVERAIIMSQEAILRPSSFDLPGIELARVLVGRDASDPDGRTRLRGAASGTERDGDDPIVVLRSLDVREAEEALIEHALMVTDGNRTRASELLGISTRTLRKKLNEPRIA